MPHILNTGHWPLPCMEKADRHMVSRLNMPPFQEFRQYWICPFIPPIFASSAQSRARSFRFGIRSRTIRYLKLIRSWYEDGGIRTDIGTSSFPNCLARCSYILICQQWIRVAWLISFHKSFPIKSARGKTPWFCSSFQYMAWQEYILLPLFAMWRG